MDPLKFHSGCVHVQWGFFIVVVLLVTWRHREFGPLTEAKVQEIPLLCGVLTELSLLPVFHAAASHFLEITSPLLLPLYLLSPQMRTWSGFFSPMDGKARASLVLWSFALTEFRCNSLFPGNYFRFIHHKASNHNNSVILRPKEKM